MTRYYYWSNAHERLGISQGEFKYLVEEGLIRYALDIRKYQYPPFDVVPESIVIALQSQRFATVDEGAEVDWDSLPIAPKDFLRPTPDFLYIPRFLLYGRGFSSPGKDTMTLEYFEDFDGRVLRLAVQGDCDGDGDFENSVLVDVDLPFDSEGFLINVRFTEDELARYEKSKQADQVRLLSDPKEISFEDFCGLITSLGEHRVQGPYTMKRETEQSRFALVACNAFSMRFEEAPTPSKVAKFMEDYADRRGEKTKLWRFDWDEEKKWINLDPFSSHTKRPPTRMQMTSLKKVIERILKRN